MTSDDMIMKAGTLILLLLAPACISSTPPDYNVTTTLRPPVQEPSGGTGGSEVPIDADPSESEAEAEVTGEDVPTDAGVEIEAPSEVAAEGFEVDAGDAQTPTALRPIDASSDARFGSDTVVVSRTCSDVLCPGLFEVTRACSGHESSCRAQVESAPGAAITVTRYCHANGVKKVARTSATASSFRTAMQVLAASGRGCYLLDMSTKAGSALEHWVFRLWSGDVLARGSWNPVNGKTLLTCDGVTYDVSATDCPGTDGEPGPGECSKGACN
jgi:hypothetical protein